MYYSLSAIISSKMQRVFQLTNHANAFPKDNHEDNFRHRNVVCILPTLPHRMFKRYIFKSIVNKITLMEVYV